MTLTENNSHWLSEKHNKLFIQGPGEVRYNPICPFLLISDQYPYNSPNIIIWIYIEYLWHSFFFFKSLSIIQVMLIPEPVHIRTPNVSCRACSLILIFIQFCHPFDTHCYTSLAHFVQLLLLLSLWRFFERKKKGFSLQTGRERPADFKVWMLEASCVSKTSTFH